MHSDLQLLMVEKHKLFHGLPVFLLALAASSALSLSSCSDSSQDCQTSYDCANDQVCIDGSCRQTCNYTSECEAGLQCYNGACVLPRNNADSGHSDLASASVDSAHADVNLADASIADQQNPDIQRDDAQGSDGAVLDAHIADAEIADHLQVADVQGFDVESLDAQGTDSAIDPCESTTCPLNMICESSADSATCLCGSLVCAVGENCVYPETAYGDEVLPICCAETEHNCDGECVNFNHDDGHCGACNQACDVGESCVASSCDCGGNGPCGAGLECCSGHCVDVLNDSANCGLLGAGAGCGNSCSDGQDCNQGSCGCATNSDCGVGDWICSIEHNCECVGVICAGECFAGADCCEDTDCSTQDTCTDWGSCEFADGCVKTGHKTRSCPHLACTNNSCAQRWQQESQSCSRDTDGDVCSSTTRTSWGSCGSFSDSCDETGTQTRNATHLECAAGICDDLSPVTVVESQDCSRVVADNTSCGAHKICCNATCVSSDADEHCGTCTRTCEVDLYCASGSCHCFPAGTPVRMADGSTKAIEQIVAGDRVMSYDFVNKAPLGTYVIKRLDHPAGSNMILLNGELKVTYEHRFYANGQWIRAIYLQLGDVLLQYDEVSGEVVEVPVISIKKIEETPETYNLKLADHHYYFANDILVHNDK